MIALLAAVALAGCPIERGTVKLLLDPDAANLNASGKAFALEDLLMLQPPEWTATLERTPWEMEILEVDVLVLGAKLENDQDFHVVISGLNSNVTMIAELGAPRCFHDAAPLYRMQMTSARAAFLRAFGPVGVKYRKLKTPLKARIRGVVHFDKLHGQLGVAWNGVEIHPLLGFEVLSSVQQ